ncbi:hypothetical protein P168DRAFT_289156 [Aspergillus campestris IBT 28561]|uniref:Pre-mRNA-splicing factor cwc26 n=1 Tax=Aspergillus campestris (strain IBT 28561) TaxID=1392248 RepID=A0A2I1D773_ASPC2|nr:uncharacterized protein P168DRAFT_289156 [Aspergillus campestris IBT 28561]PKY05721.1 hypothetical protein P168DRAFT_289156 [Aspergillus campestris IBT 28561]
MPSSLAEYLAKNYLTADPSPTEPPKKKRKKKQASTAPEGLIIADDDPPDLRTSSATAFGNDDEDGPSLVTAARSAEFRRKKKSGWKTVGTAGDGDAEQAAADAILADAVAENAARRGEAGDDEDEEEVEEDEGAVRMESGALAGLQTAADTAAMVAAHERKKKLEAMKFQNANAAAGEQQQETIYRDASGRIINVAMKRAEVRRAEEEKRIKEEQAKEALMGDVQRQQREERRQKLEEARAMPVARTIEDETMNDELREVQRWNDPAAQFLTKSKGPGVSTSGRPLYKGSFQPNRYQIRPGHRWDGVDRGNGFEKDWFAARNRRGRLEALDYQWQMDE